MNSREKWNNNCARAFNFRSVAHLLPNCRGPSKNSFVKCFDKKAMRSHIATANLKSASLKLCNYRRHLHYSIIFHFRLQFWDNVLTFSVSWNRHTFSVICGVIQDEHIYWNYSIKMAIHKNRNLTVVCVNRSAEQEKKTKKITKAHKIMCGEFKLGIKMSTKTLHLIDIFSWLTSSARQLFHCMYVFICQRIAIKKCN